MLAMGTAPGTRQHPAMPDPERTVTRSMAMLRDLGFTDYEALKLILTVGLQAMGRVSATGNGNLAWIGSVIDIAIGRLAALIPSPSHRTESTDADGSRGRAGRPEENQQ